MTCTYVRPYVSTKVIHRRTLRFLKKQASNIGKSVTEIKAPAIHYTGDASQEELQFHFYKNKILIKLSRTDADCGGGRKRMTGDKI